MKTSKLLLVIAIVGVAALPSEAADRVKRATARATPVAMKECLAPCNDAQCLRDCIANVEGPLGLLAATQQPLDGCFGEALGNITSCAAVVLLRADDAKFDVDSAFWACVNVASQLFDQCPSDDPGLTVELETMLRKMYLGHLVNAAEDDYKLFLAGKLTAYRLNVDVTSDGGDKTPSTRLNAEGEENQPKPFSECLTDYVNDLESCGNQCPAGPCLEGCQGVALDVFKKCNGVFKAK